MCSQIARCGEALSIRQRWVSPGRMRTSGSSCPFRVNVVVVGTAGMEENGTGPPVGTTSAVGTSPSSSSHNSLITMVRSRMSASSGTSSTSPSTISGPDRPAQPWCDVEP